jgi:hypothetical protein
LPHGCGHYLYSVRTGDESPGGVTAPPRLFPLLTGRKSVSKQHMLDIAASYDALAERAESLATENPDFQPRRAGAATATDERRGNRPSTTATGGTRRSAVRADEYRHPADPGRRREARMTDVRLTAQAWRLPVKSVLTDAARLRAFIDALLTPAQPIVWHDDTPPPSQGA